MASPRHRPLADPVRNLQTSIDQTFATVTNGGTECTIKQFSEILSLVECSLDAESTEALLHMIDPQGSGVITKTAVLDATPALFAASRKGGAHAPSSDASSQPPQDPDLNPAAKSVLWRLKKYLLTKSATTNETVAVLSSIISWAESERSQHAAKRLTTSVVSSGPSKFSDGIDDAKPHVHVFGDRQDYSKYPGGGTAPGVRDGCTKALKEVLRPNTSERMFTDRLVEDLLSDGALRIQKDTEALPLYIYSAQLYEYVVWTVWRDGRWVVVNNDPVIHSFDHQFLSKKPSPTSAFDLTDEETQTTVTLSEEKSKCGNFRWGKWNGEVLVRYEAQTTDNKLLKQGAVAWLPGGLELDEYVFHIPSLEYAYMMPFETNLDVVRDLIRACYKIKDQTKPSPVLTGQLVSFLDTADGEVWRPFFNIDPEIALSAKAIASGLQVQKIDGVYINVVTKQCPCLPSGKLHRVYCEYPDQIFRSMNFAMRTNDPVLLPMWLPLVYYIDAAMAKFRGKTEEIVTYRGIDRTLPEDVYFVGNCINWQAFTSTSIDQGVAAGFAESDKGSAVFIFRGTSSVDISKWSRFSREVEFLYPPNTVINVVSALTGEMSEVVGKAHLQVFEIEECGPEKMRSFVLWHMAAKTTSRSLIDELLKIGDGAVDLSMALSKAEPRPLLQWKIQLENKGQFEWYPLASQLQGYVARAALEGKEEFTISNCDGGAWVEYINKRMPPQSAVIVPGNMSSIYSFRVDLKEWKLEFMESRKPNVVFQLRREPRVSSFLSAQEISVLFHAAGIRESNVLTIDLRGQWLPTGILPILLDTIDRRLLDVTLDESEDAKEFTSYVFCFAGPIDVIAGVRVYGKGTNLVEDRTTPPLAGVTVKRGVATPLGHDAAQTIALTLAKAEAVTQYILVTATNKRIVALPRLEVYGVTGGAVDSKDAKWELLRFEDPVPMDEPLELQPENTMSREERKFVKLYLQMRLKPEMRNFTVSDTDMHLVAEHVKGTQLNLSRLTLNAGAIAVFKDAIVKANRFVAINVRDCTASKDDYTALLRQLKDVVEASTPLTTLDYSHNDLASGQLVRANEALPDLMVAMARKGIKRVAASMGQRVIEATPRRILLGCPFTAAQVVEVAKIQFALPEPNVRHIRLCAFKDTDTIPPEMIQVILDSKGVGTIEFEDLMHVDANGDAIAGYDKISSCAILPNFTRLSVARVNANDTQPAKNAFKAFRAIISNCPPKTGVKRTLEFEYAKGTPEEVQLICDLAVQEKFTHPVLISIKLQQSIDAAFHDIVGDVITKTKESHPEVSMHLYFNSYNSTTVEELKTKWNDVKDRFTIQ
eukprot:PhF_6_TR27977/c0_g1_i2/m.41403